MTVSHMHVYGLILLTRQMYTRCLPVQIVRWFNIELEKSYYLVSEHRSDGTMKYFIKLPFLSIPLFFLSRSTQLEMPDREKRGIVRKGNSIIDLRCYKLFHWTVGPLFRKKNIIGQMLRNGALLTPAPPHPLHFLCQTE